MSNDRGMIPVITLVGDLHFIIGDPEALDSLGRALIAKAKLRDRLDVTLIDGMNLPIKILTADEAMGK